ncbi:MAG TPA: alpha-ketoacid dehydrogenase subunit beta [Terriglobia bacterium]|nr:alpha-ketoacid dehydrogenase subunit beta [Terriglobia bacterium]
MRKISFAEALNQALKEEMRRDPLVFVLGEDIGRMGGLFGVTAGLSDEFGSSRVIDTPISEAAIAGAGIGAALVGTRPVIEFQFLDFIMIAMDQIVNHAAQYRYMTGGMVSVPMVMRAPVCGGIGLGAQHSKSLEAWFVHVPGLKVVMPSNAADAKGLLKTAVRDGNPILFLEHRLLYAQTGLVPDEEYLVPFGSADIKRTGTHLTLIATGRTVSMALNVADKLSERGIEIEVIDPRTLKPLDKPLICQSVGKTHRLVVVNDGWCTCGFASEIMAMVMEECFWDLDAPIKRVCNKDTPMPVAATLERAVMVSEGDISNACLEVIAA